MFDVIVVDFPDPTNFSIGKLYTNTFYALLDQHLSASGYAVMQTTSPLIARKSFWTVVDDDRGGRPAARRRTTRTCRASASGASSSPAGGPFRLPDGAARRACASSTLRRPAAAVRVSARHGARAGRGQPAVEPGAGADLRATSGARCSDEPAGGPTRRESSRPAAAAALALLAGCDGARPHHRRRLDRRSTPSAAIALRAGRAVAAARRRRRAAQRACVIVVGGGIAGLAAARALRAPASTTFALLELEDDGRRQQPRRTRSAACACPLGAHYLPVPGRRRAVEVHELLEELGLRRRVHGRPVYDERHLCHSPQERLFIDGAWHEGLLPPPEALPAASAPRRWRSTARFAAARREPRRRRRVRDPDRALAAGRRPCRRSTRITFAAWLDARRPRSRRPCAGTSTTAAATTTAPAPPQVSAWAGLHYFASRHGFDAPATTTAAADGGDGVLTWPEGNAWLAERLAAPLGERLHAGRVCCASPSRRDGVEVDAWNAASAARRALAGAPQVRRRARRSSSPRALLDAPPPALRRAPRAACATRRGWSPTCTSTRRCDDRPGARPRGTTCVYGSAALGYVDAMHQSTRPVPGPTVLTAYWALGGQSAAELDAGRGQPARASDWRPWAGRVVADLAPTHPDLPAKLRRVDLMRYGHAMSIPVPGLRGSAALQALAAPQERVQFAPCRPVRRIRCSRRRSSTAREPAGPRPARRSATGRYDAPSATSLELRSACMKSTPDSAAPPKLERGFFLILLALLTLAFAAVLWPFYGAVFWGSVLALMFQPLYHKLLARMRGRQTSAALVTLTIILLIVILPLALVTVTLVQEVAGLYASVKSGDIDFGRYFEQVVAVMPGWITGLMDSFGLIDWPALQAKVVAGLTQRSGAVAGRAVDIGGDAIDLVVGFFIAMYLLFFLLRDGAGVAGAIRAAIPLEPEPKERLLERFTTVIRATVKGNILVATAQGALGGLAFWVLGVHAPLLWGVVMAFLSLLPAIGAALIWAPVALYLVAIGQVWQGLGLIAFGVLVIGLIDNVLRPILVGKDTAMPDYVVLIATVGGLSLFGLNGFVIGPVIVAMFLSAWQLLAAKRLKAAAADEK